jgi:hypothetical protein
MPLRFFLSIPHLDSYTSSPLDFSQSDELDFSQSDSAAALNWLSR